MRNFFQHPKSKRGSALVMAIWTIAVLSIMVVSFAVEAKLQSAANVYMRERVHLDYLIEAGKTLAEMIIANHQNAPDYSEDEDIDELLEDDRWIQEKRQLKESGSSATIGPVVVDSLNPDGGTVTVQIESVGGGEGGGPKFNINMLYPEGDPHYAEIWENILSWAGVPEDDQEYFVNAWLDWRDSDDVKKGDYGDDINDGGETEYYESLCEKMEDEAKDGAKVEVYKPRNGPIPDLKELAKIGPFYEHPGLLTGGNYYRDGEVKEEDQIVVSNICNVLSVYGGNKININTASKDVLMCMPGIRNPDNPNEPLEFDEEVANAIIEYRDNGLDENGNQVELADGENTTQINDWNKLVEITSDQIGKVAQEYLAYTGGQGDGALYTLTITAASMGMKHVVKAKMTIKESKPVYLEWQEDP